MRRNISEGSSLAQNFQQCAQPSKKNDTFSASFLLSSLKPRKLEEDEGGRGRQQGFCVPDLVLESQAREGFISKKDETGAKCLILETHVSVEDAAEKAGRKENKTTNVCPPVHLDSSISAYISVPGIE